ncbi:Abi family protein [Enterococcus hulanensis]|uniref:Abi family protein n=1 Tax=Enterococcus hulanensis TaxID=2559929 RepID=UPI0010F80F15|nr:Abi family protein [Enterococcus hulanensis]
MTREKEFTDLKRQIEIQQKDRLLGIGDTNKAEKYFATKNYFNVINGFESLILDDSVQNQKVYSKGKNIKDFYRVNKLDKRISEQLFLQISNVEIELKTRIAYYFCEKYCQNGVQDNLRYQDINCYTLPSRSTGKPKYTRNFYQQRTNRRTGSREVNPKSSHKLFTKHSINIETNRLKFTGSVTPNGSDYYLKGSFSGTIKGLKTNVFNGTLKVSANRNPQINLPNGTVTDFMLSGVSGRFENSLSYSDFCKIKYPYISSYKKPPFWVIINTLMVFELIVLFHGLDHDIQNKIVNNMGDFNINNGGKEEFILCLEVLNELRNVTAHYGLVSRYRTGSNMTIVSTLIQRLNLSPKTTDKVIRFYDVIKVLSLFNTFSPKKIQKLMIRYLITNQVLLKNDINQRFYKRIGAIGVSPWISI